MRVVDTTVAIDHLRGVEAATALIESLVDRDEPVVASEIVRFEIVAGMRADEQTTTEALFRAFSWMPVSEEIARAAGAFARRYRASHGGIDAADYLIAATAAELGAGLLTTNVRHFPMLPGLEPAY